MKNAKSSNISLSSIFVLSRSHYDSVLAELRAARNSGRTLFTACELLEEKLRSDADLVRINSLVPGKRYGYLGVSPSATAERNGRMVPNHGEIYLYSATYQTIFGKNGPALVSETAWGNIVQKRIQPGMLLVEL